MAEDVGRIRKEMKQGKPWSEYITRKKYFQLKKKNSTHGGGDGGAMKLNREFSKQEV